MKPNTHVLAFVFGYALLGGVQAEGGSHHAAPSYASRPRKAQMDARCEQSRFPSARRWHDRADLRAPGEPAAHRSDAEAVEPGRMVIYVDDDAALDPGPVDPTVSDPAEDGSPAHPFDSIQKALDAASSDDEILVRDGVYTRVGNKDIHYNGTTVFLHSEHGPESCILDLQGLGAGFYFVSHETPAAILDGFTIRHGSYAAIWCTYSSPTIRNCIISDNSNYDYDGGGISGFYAGPTISNCIISGNRCTGSNEGGGIHVFNDTGYEVTITNCTIAGNGTEYRGGGLAISSDGQVTIRDCLIAGNTVSLPSSASYGGGGIYLQGEGNYLIAQCTIADNAVVCGGAPVGFGGGFSSTAG
jgi:hypothetical protein